MSFSLGTKLAHYEIVEAIGSGGMGEVYRATDTKLGREVAIKVLPEELAKDRERLARFEREAKLLASLNHPAIATLHGFEDDFLVMELVEGETLAERIARGPIPFDEVQPLFVQIAEGLEAAHAKGIIHRDLKPANIKVTPDGQVKILDFGLAKAFAPDEDASAETSQSPTLTRGTALGAIMGTASYMSPEQARGHRVDTRTDVWAFGCCLYEALTGNKPFEGENVTDILAAVVRAEPDWGKLDDRTSGVIRQCLEKNRRERYQHIGDVRIALERARAHPELSHTDRGRRRWTTSTVAVAALVTAVATGFLSYSLQPSSDTRARVRRAMISFPEGQFQRRLLRAPFAVSPDGTLLAYAAEDENGSALFLRTLDSFETRRLAGTEEADKPFFSPDGAWVGFFAAGKLKKVSVGRGVVQTIANAPASFGGSWGDDGTIVFNPANHSGLLRVSSDGGHIETLTTPDGGGHGYAHVWPQHLPGGRHVLFTVWGGADDGELERAAIVDVASGKWYPLMEASGAQYVASGHLVFSNPALGTGLLASTFDPSRPTEVGPATSIIEDVRFLATMSARPYVSVSSTGTLIYTDKGVAQATLAWMSRDGSFEPLFTREGSMAYPRISPDGLKVAFHDEQGNVGVLDTTRSSVDMIARLRRTDTGRYDYTVPVWSPDGLRITVSSHRGVSWDLYDIELSGRSEPIPLLVRDGAQYPSSWSPDGSVLAFIGHTPRTGADILLFQQGGDPVPGVATEFNEFGAVFSPDGRLLAYVSDESGRAEVYVTVYPQGTTRRISTNGGSQPVWSKDGSELFYRRGRAFLSTRVTLDSELRASTPEVVHERAFDLGGYAREYDIAPDGERFVVVMDRSTTELKVVFNWFDELERLMESGN